MKKVLILLLNISLLGMNVLPAFAIHDRKVIQSHVTEYRFEDANLNWWKGYNDEYLEGYIVKSIENNQDLKVATLRVEEARQNVKMQFSKELPSAEIGVAPLLYKMSGANSSEVSWGMPVLASYEADLFLKNHDKTKSAKKMHEVSKFNERAAYISVASAVGATYFNIVKLDKIISLQEEIIKNRKEIYELMKLRNRQGINSTADLVKADKAYVSACAGLTDYKKARAIMLNSLAVLIGENPNNVDELKRVSFDSLKLSKQIPSEISSEIITQRPDYLSAEKMVEKAGLDVKIAKKEFLPSINIMGLIFFASGSATGGSLVNWKNSLSALTGSAMLPLFTGGAKFANLRLYKNKYEQVLQNYYKTNLTAIQEVNDSLSSLKLDNEKYQKNLQSRKMQLADYNYTKVRYHQGVISNLDLIQQKQALLTIDQMVASSKTDCFIDQISLFKAVGGKNYN
jgi:NodT family efflux transporter outer membrane factor (OMF) lipoprotein